MEFEPSSWSAGSYLNVGVMWLWDDVDHVAFHLGHRVEGFQSYEDDEQFRPIADGLAKQAADVVTRFRDQFREVDDAARHYARETRDRRRAPVDDWHAYIGDPTLADAILDRLVHSAHKLHLKARESMRKHIDGDDDKHASTRKKID